MSREPRVAPLPVTAIRPEWEAILTRIPGAGLKGAHAPVNVLGTLAHAPATLGEFLDWWVSSKQRMAFSVREQEIVILHMGVLYASEYVWRHHVQVAREFGVTDGELEALRTGAIEGLASPRERALLELTTELVLHRTIRDDAWGAWAALLTPREVLDLVALVSQYVLFALTNNVFRVELEASMLPLPGLAEPIGR